MSSVTYSPPGFPPPQQPPREPEKRFLPALANAIAEWFPDLGGRSMAVSQVTVTKENVPTLPLAMCAFAKGTGKSASNSQFGYVDIEDTIIIEFWLKPLRYKNGNGTETPFWSYYPYDQLRDTLLHNLAIWPTPNNERLGYRSMHIDADPFAVTIAFSFVVKFQWCADRSDMTGDAFKISFNLCTPPGTCLPDDFSAVTGSGSDPAWSKSLTLNQ